jgi:hypothetical protein
MPVNWSEFEIKRTTKQITSTSIGYFLAQAGCLTTTIALSDNSQNFDSIVLLWLNAVFPINGLTDIPVGIMVSNMDTNLVIKYAFYIVSIVRFILFMNLVMIYRKMHKNPIPNTSVRGYDRKHFLMTFKNEVTVCYWVWVGLFILAFTIVHATQITKHGGCNGVDDCLEKCNFNPTGFAVASSIISIIFPVYIYPISVVSDGLYDRCPELPLFFTLWGGAWALFGVLLCTFYYVKVMYCSKEKGQAKGSAVATADVEVAGV